MRDVEDRYINTFVENLPKLFQKKLTGGNEKTFVFLTAALTLDKQDNE